MVGAKSSWWRQIFSTEFASRHPFDAQDCQTARRFLGNSWTHGNTYNILVGNYAVKKVLEKPMYRDL
jgi:hypothetical protein